MQALLSTEHSKALTSSPNFLSVNDVDPRIEVATYLNGAWVDGVIVQNLWSNTLSKLGVRSRSQGTIVNG